MSISEGGDVAKIRDFILNFIYGRGTPVAQRIEQLPSKQTVVGSNPTRGARIS